MNIPLPARGDDILSWARSITAGVNAIAPIGGRGTLVKESTSGFGFEGLPENKRERKESRTPYWSFSCVEDPDTHERTGGWTNCRLQIGYTYFPGDNQIGGRNLCDDGEYYVEITRAGSATIKCADPEDGIPPHDIPNSIIRIPIGTVEDGKLTTPPLDLIPVVYTYV